MVRHTKFLWVILASLFHQPLVMAGTRDLSGNSRASPIAMEPFATVLARKFKNTSTQALASIQFVRVQDNQVIYASHSNERLSPASVTKVITAAAALSKFGPVHTFNTRFVHSGNRKDSVINGDLVVIGDGDPLFVSEKLWQVAADLRSMGIATIKGDLVIDNSLFDREMMDESRDEGAAASGNAYDAPVSAFAVNFNSVALAVSPGSKVGAKARVTADPSPLEAIRIENQVKTSRPGGKPSLAAVRIGGKGEIPVFRVSGSIPVDSEPQKIYRSVADAEKLAGSYVRAFFKDAGISITGKLRSGRSTGGEKSLLTVPSYDMRRIVAGLNTFSNNFIGDMLTKRLSAGSVRPGSLHAGAKVLSDYLRSDIGISPGFRLTNGSGLSTENRLSADDVVRVLVHVEKDMTIFPDYLASFPSYGWEGSLKRRMKSSARETIGGLIRAKSGTLTDPVTVSSLAGYLKHPSEGMVAFAILINGRAGARQPSVGALRALQDSALEAFLTTERP